MATKTEAPPRHRGQVKADRIKGVAEFAAKAFAEHKAEGLWFGLPYHTGDETNARAWRCGKPGRCEYAFTLYAVPGRLNEKRMMIEKPGIYYGQCSELCGAKHGYMPIAVEAVPRAQFDAWVLSQGGTVGNPEQLLRLLR